ncbi:hypothetical protein [Bdellovibrio sp. KM01]|uniref:hypothetical protein n=1 Tax=Bdellovibrio sp. KM01 TaxID=2748865 RepID=UPI0015E926D3|nr:hypothetical protein [Bdellovibrio sp. KM01]QLY27014.1 hypothetical protein HW988_08485 [Bdellovibrio sp. KM01]
MSEKINIESNVMDERRTSGELEIKVFNQADKTRTALKKLALWWGLSLISVLLPVVHFVLVPLFFFLGFFFAWKGFKSEGQVLDGRTTCPHCGNPVNVGKGELNWPVTEICQSCARVVRMEKKEA